MTRSASIRAILVAAGILAGQPVLHGTALAQSDYPSRPVELIVTFGPGGGADLMGRQMARLLSEELGVSVPVSNVAGASGNAGLTRLATSAPDGYTIGTLIALTVASWASGLGDTSAEDFRVVAVVQSSPGFLFVPAASPHQTAEDLFAHARENPGTLRVATSGYGTMDDVTLKLLGDAGIEMSNVPFEAPAERYASPLGAHTDAIYEEPGDIAQFIEAGQLKPVLVFAEERHPEFPDVPTAKELGLDIAELDIFRSIALPAGASDEVVARLEEAVVNAVATEEWQSFCQETYSCIEPVTGEAAQTLVTEFHDMIAEQLQN